MYTRKDNRSQWSVRGFLLVLSFACIQYAASTDWVQVQTTEPPDLFSGNPYKGILWEGKLVVWRCYSYKEKVSGTFWASTDGYSFLRISSNVYEDWIENVLAHDGKLWSHDGVFFTENVSSWSKLHYSNTPNRGRMHNAAMVSHKGGLWILGGSYFEDRPEGESEGNGDGIKQMEIWYTVSEVWKYSGHYTWRHLYHAPWAARDLHTAVSFAGQIWVLGGCSYPEYCYPAWGEGECERTYYNDIWYSPDGLNWHRAAEQASWPPRCGHACVVHNGYLWLLGGKSATGFCNDVWRSLNGVDWELVTEHALWPARLGHSATSFNGKIWIMGGYDYDAHLPLRDAWVYAPEGEGEGAPFHLHSADTDQSWSLSLNELLRVVQFFNSGGYGCATGTEDGFTPGLGATNCYAHDSDYLPQDWQINLSELLRVIQFYNLGGYHACLDNGPPTEDGFCPDGG